MLWNWKPKKWSRQSTSGRSSFDLSFETVRCGVVSTHDPLVLYSEEFNSVRVRDSDRNAHPITGARESNRELTTSNAYNTHRGEVRGAHDRLADEVSSPQSAGRSHVDSPVTVL